MSTLIDSLFVVLILTNFLLLGSSRLGACIRMGAIQGIMVGILSVVASGSGMTIRIVILGTIFMVFKGVVFPYLLSRALRESDTSREVQPFVGYAASIFAGVLLLVVSFWLDARLRFPVHPVSDLAIPVSISIIMTGLFLIVARRTAVNQVIGYLVLENGIYTFGLAIIKEIPVIIELGVLMDLFVAVFVMGIAIFRINREFDHIDSDRLTTLKG